MAQKTSSLQAQMEHVNYAGFKLLKIKRGDYGYNSVYGTYNDIVLGVPIHYMRDTDPDATRKITAQIHACVLEMEEIISLFPNERLLEYDGCGRRHGVLAVYDVEGETAQVYLSQLWWEKADTPQPPRVYTKEQFMKNAQETIMIKLAEFRAELDALKRGEHLRKFDTNPDFFIIEDGTLVSLSELGSQQSELTIPAHVHTVGGIVIREGRTIKKNTALERINFEQGSLVTQFSMWTFSSCSNLKSVVIPKSVITLPECAFYDCPKLRIFCEARSKPKGWVRDWNRDKRPVIWGV